MAHRAEPSLRLRDLYVVPQGEPWPQGGERPSFNPKHRNWRRAAKVPILVLNATSLNTGHVWQFTTSISVSRLPGSSRTLTRRALRRVDHLGCPGRCSKRLVGDRGGRLLLVPFLFDPVVFQKLYKDRTVRPVDGGVFDNQGIDSLLEQEYCSILLVSDASGQVQAVPKPAGDRNGVLGRVNNIATERVRIAQYQECSPARPRGRSAT